MLLNYMGGAAPPAVRGLSLSAFVKNKDGTPSYPKCLTKMALGVVELLPLYLTPGCCLSGLVKSSKSSR